MCGVLFSTKYRSMKKFISLVFAAFLGGLVSIAVFKSFETDTRSQDRQDLVSFVDSKTNISPTAYPGDFIEASSIATPAVVHIFAEESDELAYQRFQDRKNERNQYKSPFEELFGFDDFFGGDIFGRNFYRPKQGSGSGVIISNDGYIVTNNHVVGFADEIKVTLNDGKEYLASMVGTDSSTDLAVIKIEAENLPTLRFGNSDNVRVGEWVLAVGNPFSYLTSTVTAGIVSAKGRDLDIIEGEKTIEEFIQTDAAVNPGNSGGALVNTEGEIIGINSAIATPTGVYAGYSFAIPSNLVTRVIDEIRANGNIERVNLGIAGFDLTPEIAEEVNVEYIEGAYVEEVLNGSSAQYAGILPGDVIYRVNGTEVSGYGDIKDIIKFSKVGDNLKINLLRKGTEKTIRVRLRKGT